MNRTDVWLRVIDAAWLMTLGFALALICARVLIVWQGNFSVSFTAVGAALGVVLLALSLADMLIRRERR